MTQNQTNPITEAVAALEFYANPENYDVCGKSDGVGGLDPDIDSYTTIEKNEDNDTGFEWVGTKARVALKGIQNFLPTFNELVALGKATMWRDIAEAPKDGIRFLAKNSNEEYLCQWLNNKMAEEDGCIDCDDVKAGWHKVTAHPDYDGFYILANPTHYRPIINPDDYPLATAYLKQLRGEGE